MKKNKIITLKNQDISYTLHQNHGTKRLRLSVRHDGSILISAPIFLKETIIENFIQAKKDWLLSQIISLKNKEKLITPKGHKNYIKHKNEALLLITERIKKLNLKYNFQYNKISIKNQKTLWGSCSKNGNLNFNYKIIFLPSEIQDYIIIHELCHLKELNHSPNFWNLVTQELPEYKSIKIKLKKSGIILG